MLFMLPSPCLHAVHRCSLLLQMSHIAWFVCVSVCLCVWHTGVLCTNSWTDRDAVWGGGLAYVGPRNHVLDVGPDSRMETALLSSTCGGALQRNYAWVHCTLFCFYDETVINICTRTCFVKQCEKYSERLIEIYLLMCRRLSGQSTCQWIWKCWSFPAVDATKRNSAHSRFSESSFYRKSVSKHLHINPIQCDSMGAGKLSLHTSRDFAHDGPRSLFQKWWIFIRNRRSCWHEISMSHLLWRNHHHHHHTTFVVRLLQTNVRT